MGVIHFGELNEMLNELAPGQVVRVAVLDVTEYTFKKYGVRKAGGHVWHGVHVRAFVDGHTLSCYLPTRLLQIAGGVPHPGHGQFQEYTEAWDKANTLAEQVKVYLTQHGLEVRPGVIDLGNVKPMAGHWTQAEPVGEPMVASEHVVSKDE